MDTQPIEYTLTDKAWNVDVRTERFTSRGTIALFAIMAFIGAVQYLRGAERFATLDEAKRVITDILDARDDDGNE